MIKRSDITQVGIKNIHNGKKSEIADASGTNKNNLAGYKSVH